MTGNDRTYRQPQRDTAMRVVQRIMNRSMDRTLAEIVKGQRNIQADVVDNKQLISFEAVPLIVGMSARTRLRVRLAQPGHIATVEVWNEND